MVASDGTLPTDAAHDHAPLDPDGDPLRLLLPGDDAPPERYLRLLGEGSVASEVTLSARRLDLRVDTITPSTGSNHGPVTVLVRGGGFTGVSAVTLVGGGTERTATSVAVVDGTRLHATFDLNGLAPGLYDMKVEKADGTAEIGRAWGRARGCEYG